MKKILTYVTVFAVVLMCLTACEKEKEFEPAEVANNLIGDWQGHIQEYKRMGDTGTNYYPNDDRKYVVMQFNKTTETEGTGYQLEFKNESKFKNGTESDKSKFDWKVREGRIEITYHQDGWSEVYMTYDKKSRDNISGSVFKGEFITYKGNYKYVIDLNKKYFAEWNKYFN